MKKIVVLNQKDCYIIGILVVKKAHSKKTAISLTKSYIASAEKMVQCGAIKKFEDRYWIKI